MLVQDLDGDPPGPEDAAYFQEGLGLDFPVAVDPDGAWTEAWNPTSVFPQGTVIDRHGIVRWREVGGSDAAEERGRSAVTEALAED